MNDTKQTCEVRAVPLGMVLQSPRTQPQGTTGSVAYELGCCCQLDDEHCVLLASMDEQGGGDLCVGNDAFVFRRVDEIRNAVAIPVNRGDRNYRLRRDGQPAYLAKFPAIGGFIPLGAKLANGASHPAAGRGFLMSTCIPFAANKGSAVSEPEAFFEFVEMAWDGQTLSFTDARYVRDLMGMPLNGDGPISQLLPRGSGLLAAFGVKGQGMCVVRFEFDGTRWEALEHGEPFITRPESTKPSQPGEPWVHEPGEIEPSMRKVGDHYFLYTRGTDPVGRLYRSDDGLNYRLLQERPNLTVPQVLNVGLDGMLYVATNPGTGWLRNPLVAFELLGDGREITLHDQDGIRDDRGSSIPFVDHAIGANVRLDGRWRHLVFYRVCDLKERSLHQFQVDQGLSTLIHGQGGPTKRRSFTGLYAVELEFDRHDVERIRIV
jgi:hypothetical protein